MNLPEITQDDFFNIVIMVILATAAILGTLRINENFAEAQVPKVFSGTVSDMEEIDNRFFFWDTPDEYKLVIVNGTEELRVTFRESEIEQKAFGKLEKELKYAIGDNVTVTKVHFTKTIELQNQHD